MIANKHSKISAILSIIYGIGIIVFASSCATKKISSEAPMKNSNANIAHLFEPKVSHINVPISMALKPLEAKINQEMAKVLFEDNNVNGQDMYLKVTRLKDIQLFTDDDFVYFTVPLKIDVSGRFGTTILGQEIKKQVTTDFEMVINGRTSMTISKDWEITPKTDIEYDWQRKPKIDLGPVAIPIAPIVEPILKKQLGNITVMMDNEITKKIDLKNTIKTAWIKIQEPILADANTQSWLLITPQEIKASSLKFNKNSIDLRVGIKSLIQSSSGKKPIRQYSAILPKLIIDNKIDDDFEIILSGDLPYEFINDAVKKQVDGKSFDFQNGKYKINILESELYGTENLLTMKMKMDGSAKFLFFRKKIKGDIFVQGVPYYDAVTNSVLIKNFDWSFKSKDALLKTASWVTKVGFKEKIKSFMVFPLKDKLEEVRKTVQKSLNEKGKLNEMITLKGEIKEIIPEGVYLTPVGMKVAVTGRGKINVLVEKL